MSSLIQLRPVDANDADRLFMIRAAARRQAYESLLSPANRRSLAIQNDASSKNLTKWHQKVVNYCSDQRYIFCAAAHDTEVVGWLLAEVRGTSIHIMGLYIDPGHQGQGVGGRLLNDLLERHQNTHITLTVLESNRSATMFYEKHGFRMTRTAQYPYLGVARIWMERAA